MDALPLVSVIMPVRNEARFIARSLGAVLAQDYPADRLEVLVVDGLSTDHTVSLVHSLADPRVRVLNNPGRIQARALNRGLDAAHGEVIVRVDGHAVIARDYVSRCVHYLHTIGAANVGGPQRCAGITSFGRAVAAAYRSPFGVPSRFTTSEKAGLVDTVYLGAWPRPVFEQVGRFDESLAVNEDYEHNYRIRRAGGRIFLAPDIRSIYYGRQTPGGLWQQFFRYGSGKFKMLSKNPASVRLRHVVAPTLVVALAGGEILPALRRRALIGYALANGTASLYTARRHGWSLLPWLPVVFACMHLAWGSGFWWAAIRSVLLRGVNSR